MAHDRHFVKRRLTIEKHGVVVHEMSLDNPTLTQNNGPPAFVAQVNPQIALANNALCTRVRVWASVDEFLQSADVVAVDTLWDGKVCRDGSRDADLVTQKVGC